MHRVNVTFRDKEGVQLGHKEIVLSAITSYYDHENNLNKKYILNNIGYEYKEKLKNTPTVEGKTGGYEERNTIINLNEAEYFQVSLLFNLSATSDPISLN
ncbi:hypothetical protein [Tetragenococcus halophilus]|uniref:hypothetical protein n=1 Tax=Tetragenococcus halophilus TaxID=51669 RepID=UPI000B92BDE9|nr:hypothetical protein [Tetragenococcus halophilus]MCO8284474.1 hypothetical protein [Tetragenococcus halophilus]GBD66044.1 hypothetical protein TEHN7116_1008 [Tetragenococcus halophilus subsp. halophilus]GBD78374.1 hypothetical protein TEHN7128_1603 [Tetragenococcus halophilus subsp. halophilus]